MPQTDDLIEQDVDSGIAPVRGVALGLFAVDAGWSYRPVLDEIAAAGAVHVELVVPGYQAVASSSAKPSL